ncbi:TatD family hydrolase [Neobacillus bataviensis]|uniref:TatD family hydrolase n=1 Tax=Neobacillus bataviensis TaxID=220685 RepID=UPI001CBAD8C0|nr:TatD family hydrolase [Neobacillus bataviensis]
MIDAHIHLDQYKDDEINNIMVEPSLIEWLISVSFNLESCMRNLDLSRKFHKVRAAFGYHPEQSLPNEKYLGELFSWIEKNMGNMIAIGEVGLPFYLRQENEISTSQYEKYLSLLEIFVQKASAWEKPIILHAIYDDAPIVCDLLEKYSIKKAHFHWFKGDQKTITRMIENGYFISVTPDIVYKEKIRNIVHMYPLEQMMIETDGPWPFEGPFFGKRTNPNMMSESIREISKIKKLPIEDVSDKLWQNTITFYDLKNS